MKRIERYSYDSGFPPPNSHLASPESLKRLDAFRQRLALQLGVQASAREGSVLGFRYEGEMDEHGGFEVRINTHAADDEPRPWEPACPATEIVVRFVGDEHADWWEGADASMTALGCEHLAPTNRW